MSSGSSKLLNGMVAVSSGRNIRLDVQGLRAVAVLAVLAYHANSAWLRAGFVGVDVFFVISGFIITALLVERGVKVDLVEFYAGRIKRIFPAYFVMLAIVCIVSAILFLPDDYVFFEKSLQSSVFFPVITISLILVVTLLRELKSCRCCILGRWPSRCSFICSTLYCSCACHVDGACRCSSY